ncbi:hypothetical protein [Janibacter melonis]|uniref:hypothetical protein n=1 Tax=Janibacter melonis TaxID=262209 RepID=UPI0018DC7872|nr:hypothetical protein [Janibacter melonis]
MRADLLDHPNSRSSHVVPVPRAGGVACAAGITAGLLLSRTRGDTAAPGARPILAVAALTAVGLGDDLGDVPPFVRLGAQAVAGLVASGCGAPATLAGPPVYVLAVNVVNFMDGINAMTALTGLAWGLHATAAPRTALHGTLVAGVSMGFLPWNAPVARLFLGDSGSYLIGSMIAAAATTGGVKDGLRTVLPLAPYVSDALVTLTRRATAGAPLTQAHRSHAYQRLVHEQGLTHGQVAVTHAAQVLVLSAVTRRCSTTAAIVASVVVSGAWAASPEILRTLHRRRVGDVGRALGQRGRRLVRARALLGV